MEKSHAHSSSTYAMRPKNAAAMLGIGLSTFWRYVQQGRLPQGTHLSPRCTVWLRSDLEKFLAQADANADA